MFNNYQVIVYFFYIFRLNIVIIDSRDGPTLKSFYDYELTIYLFHQTNVEHYDILLPFEFIKKSSFCQGRYLI